MTDTITLTEAIDAYRHASSVLVALEAERADLSTTMYALNQRIQRAQEHEQACQWQLLGLAKIPD